VGAEYRHLHAISWEAATTALHTGELPCSGGERRIFHLSASLADGIPVDLRDTVTGLDDANVKISQEKPPL
jgi:hypothetical protein